jgi:curved DNA-binding protein CbpA
MNYYNILQVSQSATDDEIKKQYKILALRYHPDRRNGDPEKFKEISEAYQTLSNPEKKRQYDYRIKRGRTHVFPQQTFNYIDPSELFKQFFDNNDFLNSNHGVRVYRRSVTTQINGNIKTETVTEIKNGETMQTTTRTDMSTGNVFRLHKN